MCDCYLQSKFSFLLLIIYFSSFKYRFQSSYVWFKHDAWLKNSWFFIASFMINSNLIVYHHTAHVIPEQLPNAHGHRYMQFSASEPKQTKYYGQGRKQTIHNYSIVLQRLCQSGIPIPTVSRALIYTLESMTFYHTNRVVTFLVRYVCISHGMHTLLCISQNVSNSLFHQ
jgi:hypothetical protein